MASEPLPDWVERETSEFDRIERLTWRVVRIAAVAVPTWVVLLLLVPLTGLGIMPSLLTATALATGAGAGVEMRRGTPRRRARARAPMSAGRAVVLTLLAVALLAYVVFVLRAA
jgi:hypothetical protein